MAGALEGILVVTVEQAVAAPYCSARLCEAGARVIKVERRGGDFARGYDQVAGGDSSYFFWLNQGKESIELDFKAAPDAALLHRIIARADVMIQNLAPGALSRSGFDLASLRELHPKLITCDISGYGSGQKLAGMKAYDLLVQAESGLVSISGGENEIGRIGVSICDIGAGMTAHAGILEALLKRGRSGTGTAVEVSLFGVAADWMTVPLLHQEYGDGPPRRAGLHHPSIAPYGAYPTRDDELVIVAIQNEREWCRFCEGVLENPGMAVDTRYSDNGRRVQNRSVLDQEILSVTLALSRDEMRQKLRDADIAHGSVSSVADLATHPALRRRKGITSGGETVNYPARPFGVSRVARVPTPGQHTAAIRAEFAND